VIDDSFDRSREDKGRAYYTRMEGKKERKMIGGFILLHRSMPETLPVGSEPGWLPGWQEDWWLGQ